MTTLRRPEMEITRVPVTTRRSHLAEWALGVIGAVAAAVGAWMYYVPADWILGGVAEGWYFGMLTGGGVLLAAAFGLYARTALDDDGVWTARSVTTTVLAVAAFAAAITFATIWIF